MHFSIKCMHFFKITYFDFRTRLRSLVTKWDWKVLLKGCQYTLIYNGTFLLFTFLQPQSAWNLTKKLRFSKTIIEIRWRKEANTDVLMHKVGVYWNPVTLSNLILSLVGVSIFCERDHILWATITTSRSWEFPKTIFLIRTIVWGAL